MGAAQHGGVVILVQRSNGNPTFAAQFRGGGCIGAERQEKTLHCAFFGQVNQRIWIQRKSSCGFGWTIRAVDIISATTTERRAISFGEDRETEPALIFKAMPFGGIKRHIGAPSDRCGDAFQRLDSRGKCTASINRTQFFNCRVKRSGRREQWQIGIRAQHAKAASILHIEFGAHGIDFIGRQRQRFFSKPFDQVRKRKINGDVFNARCLKRIDRDANNFARRSNAVIADQFRAQLRQFTLWTQLLCLQAQDLTMIAQAQRPGRFLHPGCRNTPDLNGYIAT